MSYYRIKSILHSGKHDERYKPRTDYLAVSRINRIVEFDEKDIVSGEQLIIKYVGDKNWGFGTSRVINWDYVFEDRICIETYLSIYEFEKIEEVDNE